MTYQPAEGELAAYVSSFYRFEYAGNNLRDLERADRPQFRFMLVGGGEHEFVGARKVTTFPVTILGPTTASIVTSAKCPLLVVAWGMQPAGWASLMGSDAEKWVDNALDAKMIFGEAIEAVRAELASMPEWPDQLALLQDTARRIFSQMDQAPFEFTAIVDDWLINDTQHEIGTLLHKTRLSLRQLERMTKRCYGLPPRKLARKYRALQAAQLMAHGDSLDDHNIGLTFYDQSHLVREIKQFTGLTPKELKEGTSLLTKTSMKGRQSMKGLVSPLVSDS